MMAAALMPSAAEPLPAAAGDALRPLFDRARAGEPEAIAALCREVRPRLFRAAYAILRDPDEADDVAQDALIRALAARFTFLGRGSVGGWMTRIAVNRAKNRRRDQRRRRDLLDGAAPIEREARGAQAGAPASADEIAERRERAAAVERALAALPGRQQDVVRLRLIGRLSFAEIAGALRVTEANARMAFSLGQKKLVAALDAGGAT